MKYRVEAVYLIEAESREQAVAAARYLTDHHHPHDHVTLASLSVERSVPALSDAEILQLRELLSSGSVPSTPVLAPLFPDPNYNKMQEALYEQTNTNGDEAEALKREAAQRYKQAVHGINNAGETEMGKP